MRLGNSVARTLVNVFLNIGSVTDTATVMMAVMNGNVTIIVVILHNIDLNEETQEIIFCIRVTLQYLLLSLKI